MARKITEGVKPDLHTRMTGMASCLFFWSLLLLATAIGAAALDYMGIGRVLLWLALGFFALSKFIRIADVAFLVKSASVLQKVYLVAVNLFLGGGALWILGDLIIKHCGI